MNESLTHQFQWVRVDMKFPIKAQEFGQIVQAWEFENARTMEVTDLIGLAERPNSALHAVLEWDESAAAHSFRQAQAQFILNSIRRAVRVDATTTELQPRKDWIHPQLKDATQRAIVRKVSTVDVRKTSIKMAYTELIQWKKKWSEYSELEEAREVVDDAIALSEYHKKTARQGFLKRRKKR
jgi:hypothetical protein